MRRRGSSLLVLLALHAASPAHAEEPWKTDSESVAKELFFRGVKLLEAGDPERALDAFSRSRATIPRRGSTVNAAICLERLGRYDEALELYEEVLTRFAADLPEADRAGLTATMATLRKRVGAVNISANVTDASVQIDGRARGTLPLTTPLRVTQGAHVVRVVKNGYETYSTKVDVKLGETSAVDARLEPLTRSGEIRIEVTDGEAADVFVDSALVGAAPWEGMLAPGRHTVWARRGDLGSAPSSLVVITGQVSLARVALAPLGPSIVARVEPRTAELAIDGIPVGVGAWQGRLPRGEHRLIASEAGYVSQSTQVDAIDPARAVELDLRLVIDPDHPRWPRPAAGHFWMGAFAAYAGTGSLGSGAEAACSEDCLSDPPANGGLIGGRIGFRFPVGVSIELGGGWLGLQKDVFRVERDTFKVGDQSYAIRYDLQDQLALRGPVVLFGASYVVPLAWRLDLLARLSGGVLFAEASDTIRATARTDGPDVEALVYGPAGDRTAVVPLVAPELGVELALGSARLGAGLAAMFLPLAGPSFEGRRLGVDPAPDSTRPGSVGNAPQSKAIETERSFGLIPIFLPGLSFRYEL